MAQKRNRRTEKQKNTLPWGPMLLSFAVGAFVMFLFHLKDNVQPAKSPAVKKTEKKSTRPKVEPKFEFYTLLPETEVVVDTPKKHHDIIVSTPNKSNPKKGKATQQTKYILQVGSFRHAADAEAHKAKLAFLGVESRIQTVTIDGKVTWHRVQVGPIMGRNKVEAIKNTLKKNGIDALLIRAK